MPKTANPPAAAPKRGDKTPPANPRQEPTPVASAPAAPGELPPLAEKPHADKPVDPPAGNQGGGDKTPPADPVIDNPAPNENDCEYVLRIFGVPPEKYMKDGALDREALQFDLNTRRHLFANRVLHRRSGA